LTETAHFWSPVRTAYAWVHSAAHILSNHEEMDGAGVARRLRGLLGAMSRHRSKTGPLEPAIVRFLKVTRSYWSGLFHCYDVPDLPRTNNDLEQYFGSGRYHERRTTGRKVASPAMVVRGSVRLVASMATRVRTFGAEELRPEDMDDWRELRAGLESRRETRRQQLRFRRDPQGYLSALEDALVQLTLPP
jgi:hypothetical protein|tara:strand:- start:10 stop:579 length:570 start_codon:yes stop_codon:yes gene_type:complete